MVEKKLNETRQEECREPVKKENIISQRPNSRTRQRRKVK